MPSGCAVSSSAEVGLDVECLHRVPNNALRLARRRMSAAEYAMLEGVWRSRHALWHSTQTTTALVVVIQLEESAEKT